MESFAHAPPGIDEPGKPLMLRILPDILAFAVGLGAAYFLKWETRDLVWSLWLCSLVLGYLTLLGALAGGAYIGFHVITHKDFKKGRRMSAILMGIAAGVFLLVFFSVHFGAFHAGHSVFLQQFFPITGLPSDGFGDAFMNPPLLWALVFQHLMAPYGLFLLPAIVAERQHLFTPLIKAVKAVRTGMSSDPLAVRGTEEPPGKKTHPLGDAMARPYINVVRMHLLIFFFGIAHVVKIDSFLVYAAVYFVYFFPWDEVKRRKASNKPVEVTAI